MSPPERFLNASEAAGRLGVSAKALRLYERRGLITPLRTRAGWRAYGPADMRRAAEIASLRALGLSLGEIAGLLRGDPQGREATFAAHQDALGEKLRQLAGMMEAVRGLRGGLAEAGPPALAFDLPWPWGGERFTLPKIRPLTYITGPLGCGKTRLAWRLAETLPDAAFLGMDRVADGAALPADRAHKARIDGTLATLTDAGATPSDALIALLRHLEADAPAALVIDMIEEGLDEPTQRALIAHLRRRPAGRPLFALTRSAAILDMAALGADEGIILCPANHSPPVEVAPYPGTPGYEAVVTCLASPEVRARTHGVIAWRLPAA